MGHGPFGEDGLGKRVRGDGRKRSVHGRRQRGVNVIHEVDRELHEIVDFPPHAPRVATPEYRAIHNQLVVEEDTPCASCRVRNSTLGDPTQNKYGSTQMETHHILEYSLANAIDYQKVNQFYLPILRRFGYSGPEFTQETLLDFIDHGRYNLLVVCDRCHRGGHRGLHSVTAPIAIAAALVRDDFDLIPGDDGQPAINPRRPD